MGGELLSAQLVEKSDGLGDDLLFAQPEDIDAHRSQSIPLLCTAAVEAGSLGVAQGNSESCPWLARAPSLGSPGRLASPRQRLPPIPCQWIRECPRPLLSLVHILQLIGHGIHPRTLHQLFPHHFAQHSAWFMGSAFTSSISWHFSLA